MRLRRRIAVACVLTVPLVIVLVVAYAAFASDDGPELQVAPGASAGAFHPVAGTFRVDDTSLEDCGDADYSCRQQAFGNIAYRRGSKAALELFESQIDTDEYVSADCHRIGHLIGSAAFARYDGNVAKTFALGSSICASGYYHGILERAFVGVNTKDKLVDVARSLCEGSGVRRHGFLDYQCRHGLGHGLMIQTGYDLPLALSTCARLETRWDDVVCTGGAFMENVTTRFGFRSSWISEDDPLYPCDEIPLRNRRSCYLRSSARILTFHESDFGKASATCSELESRWAQPCFRGLGRDAVSEARYDHEKILSLCRNALGHEGDCLFGAARTVGDGSGVPGAMRASRLCELAPNAAREACFGGVGVVVGLLYPSDESRQRACARLARRHADACSRAAAAEVDPRGREAWG